MSNLTKSIGLWGLLAIQGFCASFFVLDASADVFGWEDKGTFVDSEMFEAAIVIALVLGLIFTSQQIRLLLNRQKRMEDQLKVASGAFSQLLEEHFDLWGLTASERDVALLAIKGLSIAEIARVRETKEGTVKAQSAAIYRKAGVSGRLQLLSLFIEELMTSDRLQFSAGAEHA